MEGRPVIDGRRANVNLAYIGAKVKPTKGQCNRSEFLQFQAAETSKREICGVSSPHFSPH